MGEPSSNMDLLVFKETFSFSSFVKDNLVDNSIYGSFDCDELITQSAKIIGQERNGTILMAWDAPIDCASSATKKIVTHVGMYSALSPSHRALYTHNEQIDVCGATIDADKSLLAFTIREAQSDVVNYDTYVAEISPCNRVFSLNISSTDFRKLQFVQDRSKQPTGKTKRSSQLLVIIPNNWVCLYSFQLEPVEKGYTVVSQPVQTMVVNDLPWYQWDPHRQWLSYARFSFAPQASSARRSDPTENMLIIHVVDFNSRTHNIVLTFSISLPRSSDHYLPSSYMNSTLAYCLPVQELNMKVSYE